ncbi:MAG: magnesium/cobalt transporter CorA [Myxococcota bacterium]
MLRGILHLGDRKCAKRELIEGLALPERGYFWIDIEGQTAADLKLIGDAYRLHPLALEDCEHLDQRPKLDEYDHYLFIVIHGFTNSAVEDEVNLHEVHIFFSPRFMITVHMDPHPALDRLWLLVQEEPETFSRGSDFLLHRLCDGLVDSDFPVLEHLSQTLETLEDQVLDEQREFSAVPRFVVLKRSFSLMRRTLSPQREVLGQLIRLESGYVSDHAQAYFRDIYDHLVRLAELVEVERELLASARDAHFTILSHRTNEIMKRLTMASIIFLPLTVITGFFGMNFIHMPFDNDYLLLAMLTSMVIIPVLMVLWFQHRRWL